MGEGESGGTAGEIGGGGGGGGGEGDKREEERMTTTEIIFSVLSCTVSWEAKPCRLSQLTQAVLISRLHR